MAIDSETHGSCIHLCVLGIPLELTFSVCSYSFMVERGPHFPPPWAIVETDASLIVVDGTGQRLAYLCFEDEPQRRSNMHLLMRDEARRIARGIARLPELMTKGR